MRSQLERGKAHHPNRRGRACSDKKGKLISSHEHMRRSPASSKKGVVTGGMIPKLECCMKALDGGVMKAHIVDGRVPAIPSCSELFTDCRHRHPDRQGSDIPKKWTNHVMSKPMQGSP
ncbi:MAG: hypothetical protein MZV70_73230 [Desulfobacterales bacterium]|nr:hypothetical protein [Desulfobacterales bacterium]